MTALPRQLGLTLAAAALLLAGTAAPAAAHDVLTSTAPGDQQSVAHTPSTVVLTFEEPAVAMGTQVVVTGPTGPVQIGPARLVDNTVSQDLQGNAPAGSYSVSWRVTSDDGHPISGQFTFTSKAAGTGSATGATPSVSSLGSASETASHEGHQAETSEPGLPWWAWALIGAAVIVGVVAVVRAGGGSDTAAPPAP